MKQAKKSLRNKFLTVRLPQDVETELRKRAGDETRTLSAQALHYIQRGLKHDTPTAPEPAK